MQNVTDFGRPIQFGYFLEPAADQPLLDQASELELRGYDYVGIQDHPYQRRYVDTWTLLSMIAARTSRLRLLPDVVNLALRPPAVLAKAAASLDLLSDGRFELGLGSGGFLEPIVAYGGPRRSPREAYESLAEAIEVIRLVWSGRSGLRFEGTHYRLGGAKSGPVPAHPIGIWLGVYGPRALRLTGATADGWLPSLRADDAAALGRMARQVDAAATDAGRDPADVRRVLNISGTITDRPSTGLLNGPVEQWVDELTDLAVGLGFDTFVLMPGDGSTPTDGTTHARFVEEIAPAVRDQVGTERG